MNDHPTRAERATLRSYLRRLLLSEFAPLVDRERVEWLIAALAYPEGTGRNPAEIVAEARDLRDASEQARRSDRRRKLHRRDGRLREREGGDDGETALRHDDDRPPPQASKPAKHAAFDRPSLMARLSGWFAAKARPPRKANLDLPLWDRWIDG